MNAKKSKFEKQFIGKKSIGKFAHDFAEFTTKLGQIMVKEKANRSCALKMFQTMKPILDENISWFIL